MNAPQHCINGILVFLGNLSVLVGRPRGPAARLRRGTHSDAPGRRCAEKNRPTTRKGECQDPGPARAVTVISTWAPAGSPLTSTVVRPGGLALKYSA